VSESKGAAMANSGRQCKWCKRPESEHYFELKYCSPHKDGGWGDVRTFEPEPILGEASLCICGAIGLDSEGKCILCHKPIDAGGASTGKQPPRQQTRFEEFDDANHPANKWWREHGEYMLSGGGRREFIWACRGWIAHEQYIEGAEVTGDSLCEIKSEVATRPVSGTEPVQGDNVLQDGPVNRLHEALAAAYKWNDERKKAAVGGTEESAGPRLDVQKIAEECFNAPMRGNSSDGERIKAIAKVLSKYLTAAAPSLADDKDWYEEVSSVLDKAGIPSTEDGVMAGEKVFISLERRVQMLADRAAPSLTPRCPKCKTYWNVKPDDFREWIEEGQFKVFCSYCSETFIILHLADFRKFFSAQEAGQ
jgi:hypothetical protein